MQRGNTRRGKTQQEDIGQVKPDASRKQVNGLSVIYRPGIKPTMSCNAHPTACWVGAQPIKGVAHTLYPALQACGMTKCVSRGFTLLELLVVVLIIGILAAIALPQYQKAVFRSRLTNVWVGLHTVEQAVEMYVLTNGVPNNSGGILSFKELDVAEKWFTRPTPFAADYCVEQGAYCSEKYCEVGAHFQYLRDGVCDDDEFTLEHVRIAKTGLWKRYCVYYSWAEECKKWAPAGYEIVSDSEFDDIIHN